MLSLTSLISLVVLGVAAAVAYVVWSQGWGAIFPQEPASGSVAITNALTNDPNSNRKELLAAPAAVVPAGPGVSVSDGPTVTLKTPFRTPEQMGGFGEVINTNERCNGYYLRIANQVPFPMVMPLRHSVGSDRSVDISGTLACVDHTMFTQYGMNAYNLIDIGNQERYNVVSATLSGYEYGDTKTFPKSIKVTGSKPDSDEWTPVLIRMPIQPERGLVSVSDFVSMVSHPPNGHDSWFVLVPVWWTVQGTPCLVKGECPPGNIYMVYSCKNTEDDTIMKLVTPLRDVAKYAANSFCTRDRAFTGNLSTQDPQYGFYFRVPRAGDIRRSTKALKPATEMRMSELLAKAPFKTHPFGKEQDGIPARVDWLSYTVCINNAIEGSWLAQQKVDFYAPDWVSKTANLKVPAGETVYVAQMPDGYTWPEDDTYFKRT